MLFSPIKPMLLQIRTDTFDDPNYIFEPKWDGWRILLYKQGDRVEAYTRNGRCITNRFPELREAGAAIHSQEAILDCEGVCIRDGRSVFDDFQLRGRLTNQRRIARESIEHPATLVAFDVLQTEHDHTREPLMVRKQILQDIVQPSKVIIPTMYVEGAGIELKKMTEERNWEGIVAKRKDSIYRPNLRSDDWLKIKNWRTTDTVILGYRLEPMFALIVGLHFPTVNNKPVATVEFGFRPEEKRAFLEIAKQIHTVKDKRIQWIEPRLCCRIQYLERTDNHHLRMTSFKSFLIDKKADDCLWVS